MRLPDAQNAGIANSHLCRERSCGPVGCVRWLGLGCPSDDFKDEAQRDPWGAPMYARAKGVDRAEVATAIATRDLKQKAKNYVEYTLRRAEERIRPVWQIGMGI